MSLEDAARAVIRVGEGRGFVVKTNSRPLVITAAHCLPFFPLSFSASGLEHRTYQNLIGPREGHPTVWAECLFVDSIGDIAVLGPPDDQGLSDHHEAFEEFLEQCEALQIADAPRESSAFLLSLDGEWCPCQVQHRDGPLWIFNALDGVEDGMSGSPIVSADGSAIGVVATSGGVHGEGSTEGGPNPRLTHNLPAWVLREPIREQERELPSFEIYKDEKGTIRMRGTKR